MGALSDLFSRLDQLGATELRLIQTGAVVLVLLALRWLVLGLVRRRKPDVRSRYVWRKGTTYVTTIVGILLIGRIWFAAVGSLATVLGLIGAGLAIALKDPVTNLAGWIFILWRRPFRVGDRVQIGAQAGDIIDLRLFQFTMLEIGNWVDADQSTGRILHIPNGKVFTEPTANYTAGFPFIWNELPVLVTFESNWRAAREILLDLARRHAGEFATGAERDILAASRQYMIFYSTLQPTVYTSVLDSGVLLTIRYACEVRQRRGTAAALWEDVLEAFAEQPDVDFAYPTTRYYAHDREGKPALRAEPEQ